MARSARGYLHLYLLFAHALPTLKDTVHHSAANLFPKLQRLRVLPHSSFRYAASAIPPDRIMWRSNLKWIGTLADMMLTFTGLKYEVGRLLCRFLTGTTAWLELVRALLLWKWDTMETNSISVKFEEDDRRVGKWHALYPKREKNLNVLFETEMREFLDLRGNKVWELRSLTIFGPAPAREMTT